MDALRGLPGWLTPALGLWVVVVAVALANTTAVTVSAGAVTLALGVLALGHGLLHRRWSVAGPCAVLALAATVAVVFDLLPAGVSTTSTGPAGTSAPKLIWTALAVIVALEIIWGLLLHTRVRHAVQGLDGPGARALTERQAAEQARLSRGLDDLDDRLDRVERLLTEVR